MPTRRRTFLKVTTAGATGLILTRGGRAFAAWPTTGNLAVNPNISNLRVVGLVDTTMMKSTPTTMTFAAENAVVDAARVAANMDAMAMSLANAATADSAWKAIFRSSKPWNQTLVAIKVNTIEPRNMARLAVIQKFCQVLAGLGVTPANTVVYDGNSTYGAGISNYTSYFSLTDSTKIPAVVSSYNGSLGGDGKGKLPDGTTADCTAKIADGTVDILINIANNKGHSMFGGSTLCMKNHFGTFAPNHTNLANYVFNINKSDAILGGTPVRQQLCFIDSLIANKAANTGTPEAMPCYLIMGTFAPVVDYLTVKKVREEVLKCTHDTNTVNSFLTSFGYTANDPVWILVPPAGAIQPDAGVATVDTKSDTSTGGAPSATGGSSTATGGAPSPTGGTNTATGGGARTGGTSPSTGGTTSATGGTLPATGGSRAGTGGVSSDTGGASSAKGSVMAATGGTAPATGGSPIVTSGGVASSTGGTTAAGGSGTGRGCDLGIGLPPGMGWGGFAATVGVVLAGKFFHRLAQRDGAPASAEAAEAESLPLRTDDPTHRQE